MPEADQRLANWRRTLSALVNAVGLVEDGALSPDDALFMIAIEAESDARGAYLGPMSPSTTAVTQGAELRHRAVTNLPGDAGRGIASWPLGATWTTPESARSGPSASPRPASTRGSSAPIF
jgi:hypothetical protein